MIFDSRSLFSETNSNDLLKNKFSLGVQNIQATDNILQDTSGFPNIGKLIQEHPISFKQTPETISSQSSDLLFRESQLNPKNIETSAFRDLNHMSTPGMSAHHTHQNRDIQQFEPETFRNVGSIPQKNQYINIKNEYYNSIKPLDLEKLSSI